LHGLDGATELSVNMRKEIGKGGEGVGLEAKKESPYKM
jgi:hypothetical protein